jgi:hypothetical protein
MNPSRQIFERAMSALWATLALTLISGVALAQIGTPRAPRNLLPANLTQQGYISNNTTIDTDFLWVGSPFGLNASPAPTHFALCIYDAATTLTPPCSWTGASWTMPAGGGMGLATPVPVPPPSPWIQSVDLQYRFNPPSNLSDLLLDRPLKWTVGACVANAMGPSGMYCGFAPAKDAYFVARNVKASNADMDNSTAAMLNVESRVTSPGSRTSNSGPFEVNAHVWQVLRGTAANGAPICRTDVNAADVRDVPPNVIHYVFFTNRREMYLADLPVMMNGQRDGTGVIAIYRAGMPYDMFTASVSDFPGGIASSRGVLNHNFPQTTTDKAFVATTHVDQSNTMVEFDETDNVYSRCKAF